MRFDANHFSTTWHDRTRNKIILAFTLGGAIAVAPLVVFIFFNDVFNQVTSLLPIRFRGYALFLPMPAFFIGGFIGGMSTRSGIRGALAFGVAFLVPGFYILNALVGTQGARGIYDVLWLTVILPSVCYCFAGAFGAGFLGCGIKGVLRISAGFAVGAFLGSAFAWITDVWLAAHLGRIARIAAASLGLVFPWCLGGLTVATVLATRARGDTPTPPDGGAAESPSAPSS